MVSRKFLVDANLPLTFLNILILFSVPTESPTDIYARPVSSTEAVVWWLPVVDTGTGLQQYVEGYQVQTKQFETVRLRPTMDG